MEEIKKIEVAGQQYGVADILMRSVMGGNAQVIEWSHTHNMNDYKEAGTYRIKGERTGSPMEDNLPIMNQGSGHTLDGILYVLDSSLPNGSGDSDDCTVTQFLMLSNRVGGQEGDMYMRSGYGATKDSLYWKPWEKYQTNREVGCVSDLYILNPSNPTQVISYGGLIFCKDNGIYSGVYVGPKAAVGTQTTEYIEFQDPTGIETFVMVVINNYAAAGDAKTITQIKFAVTNGGVFSMEKRTYTTNWSEWETIGGGSSLGEWNSNGHLFTIDNNEYPDRPIKFGNNITIGSGVQLGENVNIGMKMDIYGSGDIGIIIKNDGNSIIHIGTDSHSDGFGGCISLGRKVHISEGVCIGTGFDGSVLTAALKIQVNETGDQVIFSYNGKTAELQLT